MSRLRYTECSLVLLTRCLVKLSEWTHWYFDIDIVYNIHIDYKWKWWHIKWWINTCNWLTLYKRIICEKYVFFSFSFLKLKIEHRRGFNRDSYESVYHSWHEGLRDICYVYATSKLSLSLEFAVFCRHTYITATSALLLPDTSFPFMQGLSARVLGLWLNRSIRTP